MLFTFSVRGRNKTYSENQLVSILEQYEALQEAKALAQKTKSVSVPQEGEWFEVNPLVMNRTLFATPRKDANQEVTRQLILEAFEALDANPQKYARLFQTKMPEKLWQDLTVRKLENVAIHTGNHMADWVEQALEWAQRIINGETWKAICNDPDRANWSRLIWWKNGSAKIVGGGTLCYNSFPSTYVFGYDFALDYSLRDIVPLVVSYK